MIHVRVFNAHPKYKIRHSETFRTACFVLKCEHQKNANLNVIFINDRKMINLNRTYLKHQYTTDVLSFPLDENDNDVYGEVYINLDQARRQANDYHVTIKNEVERLIIHGILHLVGYQDRTKHEKVLMREIEDSYILKLV